MLKNRALRTELASAALAIGILGATPSFAQNSNDLPPSNATEHVLVEPGADKSNFSIDPYNPIVPEGVLWGLCALIVAGGGYQMMRRREGGLSRTLAMAAGAMVLVNPQTVTDEVRTHPTEFLILVDKSESQAQDGRDILTSSAYEQLEERLASYGQVNIRTVEFGNDFGGTSLAQTLETSLQKIPSSRLGGVFVLTDGVIEDIDTALEIKNINAPLHMLVSGAEDEKDLFIRIEDAPHFAKTDGNNAISFFVGGNFDESAAPVSVTVTMSLNGAVLNSTSLPLNALSSLALPNLVTGDNTLELSVTEVYDAQSGAPINIEEVTLENNRISTTIEGIGEPLDVLLLSGAPYQGTAAWRDFLGRDPDLALTHFVSLRPAYKEDATPLRDLATTAMPVHEIFNDKLQNYDVIIFDKRAYNGEIPLVYMQKIAQAVEAGASLLIVGGEEFNAGNSLANTGLGAILPLLPDGAQAIEREFVPQITDGGVRHPLGRILQQAAPADGQWGAWYSAATTKINGNATVIMDDGQGHPLLALSKYGEGRVAVLASDQNWLWMRGAGAGGPGTSLYQNLTGWLAGEEIYDEENITLRHENGNIVVDLQTMGEDSETIKIVTPRGAIIDVTPEEISPGLRRAFIPVAEAGVYKAERQGAFPDSAFAQIGFADPVELLNVVSRLDLVEPLSSGNGGMTVRMAAPDGTLALPDLALIQNDAPANDQNANALGIRMSTDSYVSGTKREPLIPYSPIPEFFAFLTFLMLSLKREGSKDKTWKEALDVKSLKFWGNNDSLDEPKV